LSAAWYRSWAYGLVRDSALVLLDAEDDPSGARHSRRLVEPEGGGAGLGFSFVAARAGTFAA